MFCDVNVAVLTRDEHPRTICTHLLKHGIRLLQLWRQHTSMPLGATYFWGDSSEQLSIIRIRGALVNIGIDGGIAQSLAMKSHKVVAFTTRYVHAIYISSTVSMLASPSLTFTGRCLPPFCLGWPAGNCTCLRYCCHIRPSPLLPSPPSPKQDTKT